MSALEPIPRRRRFGRIAMLLRNVACFVLGGVVAGWAIRHCLPVPGIPDVEVKLRHLQEHREEYDTLFFGSSRIYHQIDPRLFDQLTAEAGRPTRSFNAGINAMAPPELNRFVEDVLQHPLPHLRWVIIEAGFLNTALNTVANNTAREVYWHDLPRMRLLLRAALETHKPLPRKATWARTILSYERPWRIWAPHGEPFRQNLLNAGYGEELLTRLLRHPEPMWGALGDRRDGFNYLERDGYVTPERLAAYEAEMAELRAHPAVTAAGGAAGQTSYDAMLRRLEQAGARCLVVTAPTTGQRKFVLQPELAHGRLQKDYSDPERYPELFAWKNRLDGGHLSLSGAEIWTRLIVRDFCEGLPDQPATGRAAK